MLIRRFQIGQAIAGLDEVPHENQLLLLGPGHAVGEAQPHGIRGLLEAQLPGIGVVAFDHAGMFQNEFSLFRLGQGDGKRRVGFTAPRLQWSSA